MKGIIIAGGFGTRLRPLTYARPKPLAPVANRPFLEYQVALLKKHGIDDIVFATNYMADAITSHFGDGAAFGVRMRCALEDTPLGTGGAIRNAADLFPGETVAVFNGDVLTDFDLGRILDFHQEKKAVATITLYEVPSPNPFGVLILDGEGRVKAWNEPTEEMKKRLASGGPVAQTGTDLINAGFYVFAPEFLAAIPPGVPSSVERDIFPKLLAEGGAVYGFAPGGYWQDVGRAEQLMAATQAVLGGEVSPALPGAQFGAGCEVSPDAQVDALTALGRGCKIGPGAHLTRCILMDNVTVGANARLSDVIVDRDSVVGEEAVIAGNPDALPVLAAGSVLGKGTRL